MRARFTSWLALPPAILLVASAWGVTKAADSPAGEQPAAEAPAGGPEDNAVYFFDHVMPLTDRLGCNAAACHGSLKGKGGLKLSMFGADPKQDYTAVTKSDAGRRVNMVEPARSLLILKATGSIAHQGGQKVQVGSQQHKMLVSWVAGGVPWADEKQPELVAIKVSPEKHTLEKGKTGQISTTAVFSDGSQKDVTGYARFKSSGDEIASVDEKGEVTAAGFGQCTIVVSFMRKFGVGLVVVPQPLSDPFPEFKAHNKIDELVVAKLKELGIPPSELCSDQEFLRRVYLDVIGTLPTPDEARAFLADADPQKRNKLIDRLLACDEFADYWALKWGDLFRIKSEYPSNLWPNAVQAYHRWVRDSIAKSKPYDQFARELIASSGSNFRVPQANYYRAFLRREPQNLAEVTALVFMGARVGCARCHGHPHQSWTLADNAGMAAFFAGVRFKRTQEWKEEIVYVNPKQTMRLPGTNELVQPKFLDGEVWKQDMLNDPRAELARWLTAPENPWFARSIVNRTWFWLLGRGIVHEVDDLRATNPPENPELLQHLEKELLGNGYDLKHIYRLILNSRTYQLSSKSNELNQHDVAHFSHYQVKRLGAETLLDAIGHVTERWDTYQSRIPEPFVKMPAGFRATHLADGSIGIPFLELFGRPPRDTAFESDRDLRLSMRQTLHLLNSSDVQNKINASPRIKRLMTEVKDDSKIVEEIYMAALSRPPTQQEGKGVLAYFSGEGKSLPEQVVADKKAAEEALAKVREELKKATADHQAAEKAAQDAQAEAAKAKAEGNDTEPAQMAAQKAAEQRKAADEAKANRDKLAAGEKAAVAKLAAADRKLNSAKAALKPRRDRALQDLLWALLNTKEFLFNH